MIYTENDFRTKAIDFEAENKVVHYQAPSNIALVKYWGKKAGQIPANPSVSFTLSTSKTITSVAITKSKYQQDFSFDFSFDSQPRLDFHPKIEQYLTNIKPYLSFLASSHLNIDSINTFPHSSGIASSASSMAALSACLMEIESQLNDISSEFKDVKTSFLARIGSGSACRSVKGSVVLWGQHVDFEGSSDLYGVDVSTGVDSVFLDYQDTILLVDVGEKQVSSSLGHSLMNGHPFAGSRFEQAVRNTSELYQCLQTADLEKFIHIVESEALTLHSMMMTSSPYFILMQPQTLGIIQQIWEFRSQTQIPVCFTLDAGANVHLLYPKSYAVKVLDFVDNELSKSCKEGKYLKDSVGNGASKIESTNSD
ncbi:MAG: diphosphomevalonate decarboxylase [Bacteroidota bacterium]|nr:diphosphomevalonate decarboxylase [Bacteroidota bacterium]